MIEDKQTRPIGSPLDDSIKYWRGRDGRFHSTAGENSRTSKVNEEVVRIIKFERRDESAVALAKEFGLHPGYVRQIRQGRAWSHVKQ